MRTFLVATLEYPPFKGGIATYLDAFVRAFPPRAVTVLAPEDDEARTSDMEAPAPIFRRRLLSRYIRPRWLRAWYEVDKLWRKERHGMLVVSHVLPMGTVAWLLRRTRGVPYAVIVHGLDVGLALERGGLKRLMASRILKDASRVIANSAYTAGLVASLGVPKEQVWIARPSPGIGAATIPPEQTMAMRTALGFASGDGERRPFGVLAMGRLVRRKGFDDVIRAVAALVGEGRAIRLAIAGAGSDRERLERIAEDLQVRSEVSFPGRIPDADLQTAYAACDVFAMTPRGEGADVEGFGIVYLEANIMGKPVIASRSGGVPEAVVDGETGLLVEPGNVAQIAHALRRLMDDRELGARLGAQGRERALRDFAEGRQIRAAAERLAHDA